MRWIIRGVILLVAVVIIGMTALFAIPTDEITARALDRVSETTGRDVSIRGSVRPRLFPSLGIRAEDIEIGNPDWVEDGPMVAAQALDIGVAWGPLFRGEVHLQTAELIAPRLILVRGEDGRVSWDMSGTPTEAPTGAAPTGDTSAALDDAETDTSARSRIAFDSIVIEDAALLFVDRQSGRTLQYDPVAARITAPNTSGLVDVAVTIGQPGGDVSLSLSLGSIAALQNGETSDLGASLAWPGGEAAFDGRVALMPSLEGRFTLSGETLAPVFELGGLAAPLLPAGLGRDRFDIGADVTLSEAQTLHLRDARVVLDDNALEMELDLVPGEQRPLLRGNIGLGRFSLPDGDSGSAAQSGAGTTSAAAPTTATSGWSEAPIDASALFALDTDLAVTAERVEASGVAIEALTARILTDNGRSEIDLGYASIFGGAVAGRLVANGRGTFSTSASLELTEIALQPALSALAGIERLEGSASGAISLIAQGASVAALMSDLDGEGALELGPGAIIGLDIAGMIRNFDAGFQGEGARTVYSGVTASFSISDGVLLNDDLSMTAPWGAVTGGGEVDIGARGMDYLVTPGVSARDDGTARVNVPVRIEGPWDDLSFRPDLEALANQELSEEIDALEDAASEAVRDLVSDELGIEIDEDASREEAIDQIEEEIGDRLQEEVIDGLRSLFD